jgi:hypothetical protein
MDSVSDRLLWKGERATRTRRDPGRSALQAVSPSMNDWSLTNRCGANRQGLLGCHLRLCASARAALVFVAMSMLKSGQFGTKGVQLLDA